MMAFLIVELMLKMPEPLKDWTSNVFPTPSNLSGQCTLAVMIIAHCNITCMLKVHASEYSTLQIQHVWTLLSASLSSNRQVLVHNILYTLYSSE